MRAGDSVGRITATLVDAILSPMPLVKTGHPAIYMHSLAADGREALGYSLPAVRPALQTIVEGHGLSIVAPSASASYGTAGLVAGDAIGGAAGRVEQAATYHAANYNSTGKSLVLGTSMGSTNALIYALEHPTLVSCMVLFSPVFDLVGYAAANTQGQAANLFGAWGNPINAKGDIVTRVNAGGLAGISVLWIGSSDDPYSTGAFATNYAAMIAATGGFQQALGAVGHGNGTVAAADLTAMLAFVRAHI